MNAVNRIGGYIHGALESKGHIRSPQIIVNGLGKGDYIESLLAEKVGGLLASISSQHHQAAELELLIGVLHRLYLVKAVLVRDAHELKGLAGGSQNRAALGENTGKIRWLHNLVICIHQSLVSILKSNDLHIIEHIV